MHNCPFENLLPEPGPNRFSFTSEANSLTSPWFYIFSERGTVCCWSRKYFSRSSYSWDTEHFRQDNWAIDTKGVEENIVFNSLS